MLIRALALLLAGLAGPAGAGTLIATRTLPAGTVLAPEDVTLTGNIIEPDDSDRAAAAIGRQARIAIYEGREVLPANLISPTLVERNAIVTVTYASGGLSISTEGRALGRGGAGDTIRVLNLASRVTITAQINPDGTLRVVSRQ